MPPKRKRTDDVVASTTSTRATRSSTRASNPSTSTASPKKSKATKGAAEDDLTATETPPAKKTKTTKASIKATSRTTKQAATKGATASSSRNKSSAEGNSDAVQLSDDEASTQKTPPETSTQPTVDQPAIPALTKEKAQSAAPPPPGANEPYSPERATALFKSYADEDDIAVIGPEGYEKLCTDAKIPLEGAAPLILAWQIGAKEMGKVTEEEWRNGTESLRISSLYALSLAVKDIENLLILDKSPATKAKKEAYDKSAYWTYAADKKAAFRKLYTFCFLFAKPEQSKNIEMETATALWSVLLVPRYPLMSEVVVYINERPKEYKAANKDLWSMMLEFCDSVNPNLSDYEGDGAWPTLLDNFVLWKKGPTTAASDATTD